MAPGVRIGARCCTENSCSNSRACSGDSAPAAGSSSQIVPGRRDTCAQVHKVSIGTLERQWSQQPEVGARSQDNTEVQGTADAKYLGPMEHAEVRLHWRSGGCLRCRLLRLSLGHLCSAESHAGWGQARLTSQRFYWRRRRPGWSTFESRHRRRWRRRWWRLPGCWRPWRRRRRRWGACTNIAMSS